MLGTFEFSFFELQGIRYSNDIVMKGEGQDKSSACVQ